MTEEVYTPPETAVLLASYAVSTSCTCIYMYSTIYSRHAHVYGIPSALSYV